MPADYCVCMEGGSVCGGLREMPGGSKTETACASCPPQQGLPKTPCLGFDVAGGLG